MQHASEQQPHRITPETVASTLCRRKDGQSVGGELRDTVVDAPAATHGEAETLNDAPGLHKVSADRFGCPLQQLPTSEGHPVVGVAHHWRSQHKPDVHMQGLGQAFELSVELDLVFLDIRARQTVRILQNLEELVHLQMWRDEEHMVQGGLETSTGVTTQFLELSSQRSVVRVENQALFERCLCVHTPAEQLFRGAFSQVALRKRRGKFDTQLGIVQGFDGSSEPQPTRTSVGEHQVVGRILEHGLTVDLHRILYSALEEGRIPYLTQFFRPPHGETARRCTRVLLR
mmetsp:Transcript_7717/g.21072  ORF Transcript_7717/g.21072 Transcript_7717/m.21072 type:complete len:287 (-) Transcript_7717:188-1048(-)